MNRWSALQLWRVLIGCGSRREADVVGQLQKSLVWRRRRPVSRGRAVFVVAVEVKDQLVELLVVGENR